MEESKEAQARESGWVPKEEWAGPEDAWVDADTFVERGERIASIATSKNKKLSEEVDTLRGELNSMKESNKQFKEFFDRSVEAERKRADQAIQELEAVKARAISEGDGQKVIQTEKQIETLKAETPEKPEQIENYPESTKQWMAENTWYESDPVLRGVADGLANNVAEQYPDLVGTRAFLDKLTERVQKEMPHKFKNPARERADVEAGGPGTKNSKAGHSWEDLPDDVRHDAERMIRDFGITKEQYLAQVAWEE